MTVRDSGNILSDMIVSAWKNANYSFLKMQAADGAVGAGPAPSGEIIPLAFPLRDFPFSFQHVATAATKIETRPHGHDNVIELQYFYSGSGRYYINGRIYQIRPKKMLLIGARAIHSYLQYRGGDVVNKVAFFFSPGLIGEFSPQCVALFRSVYAPPGGVARFLFSAAAASEVEQILAAIKREWKTRGGHFRQSIPALIIALLSLLARHRAMGGEKKNEEDVITRTVLPFIEKNYTTDLTLLTIARELQYSPFYLSRRFKKVTGFSFRDYLIEKRIHLACDRFQADPQRAVIDIAFDVGYNDLTTFNRNFKKVTCQTPSRYRNLCLKSK